MNEILSKITDIIETYESGAWQSTDNLRAMLRELTSNYYYLTKYNIEAFQNHNAVQYKHKGSVSSGLILANEQVPELRMLLLKLIPIIDIILFLFFIMEKKKACNFF